MSVHLATKKIHFRDLKPGDLTVLDGETDTVKSVRYGDGLVSFEGRTAKPVVVGFESGKQIIHHPGNRIVVTR